MIIRMNLSQQSIEDAIRKLTVCKEEFEYSVSTLVRTLTSEGAEKAQIAFGGMAKVSEEMVGANTGKIVADGKAPGVAEFGAGYATMEDHPFAGNVPYEVAVASYAKNTYPYGLFYITHHLLGDGEGYWFFGGEEYQRVEARHGLLNAYEFLLENGTEIAQEVLKLD